MGLNKKIYGFTFLIFKRMKLSPVKINQEFEFVCRTSCSYDTVGGSDVFKAARETEVGRATV